MYIYICTRLICLSHLHLQTTSGPPFMYRASHFFAIDVLVQYIQYIYTNICLCMKYRPLPNQQTWDALVPSIWPSGSSDALGKRWAKTARARGDSVTPRSWNGTDVWQHCIIKNQARIENQQCYCIFIKHITVHTVYYSMHLYAKMPFPWEGLTLTPRASVVVLTDWQLFQHEVQKQKRFWTHPRSIYIRYNSGYFTTITFLLVCFSICSQMVW